MSSSGFPAFVDLRSSEVWDELRALSAELNRESIDADSETVIREQIDRLLDEACHIAAFKEALNKGVPE